MEVARGALGSYAVNLPLDTVSLVYAAVGLVLAILLYQGLKLAACSSTAAVARRVRRIRTDRLVEPTT